MVKEFRKSMISFSTRPLWMQVVIVLCGLTAALPVRSWAQEAAQPSERLTKVQKDGAATIYAFNYPTVNAAGEKIVLSSALVAWIPDDRKETDSIESIHVYNHATIGSDKETPSREDSKELTLVRKMATRTYKNMFDPTSPAADYVGRCIIIAPDYEGYGVTKHLPHPYLAQRLTAQQVLDAFNYGLDLYRKQAAEKSADFPLLPIKSDWRTFFFGYSQGAAVTLALQRMVEEKGLAEQMHFYGSICGDGPYDLIETLRYYIEDNGESYNAKTDHRKGISNYPIVVPLIVRGMCMTHPELAKYKVEDFLSQQLLDTSVFKWIDSKEHDTSYMSKLWYDQLIAGLDTLGRHYSPEQMAEMFTSPKKDKVWGRLEKMFTPATYAYLSDTEKMATVPAEATNAQQALHRALADNQVVTGWEPKHRIQFYHSRGDMVVPFGNYEVFQKAHAAGEKTIYRVNDTFADSDHIDAAGIFFLELCMSQAFAANFNWICEGLTPTGINVLRPADIQSHSGNWFTLDGRRLGSKPTTKGVYIHNNKKVVIK